MLTLLSIFVESEHSRRALAALAVFALIHAAGTLGYLLIGGPGTTVIDALYMTFITVATIGLVAPGILVVTRMAGGTDHVRGFEKPVIAFVRSVEAGKAPDLASLDPQLLAALNWLAGCGLWVLAVVSGLLLVLQW